MREFAAVNLNHVNQVGIHSGFLIWSVTMAWGTLFGSEASWKRLKPKFD
jgi:hypothetical protein